nr:RNA-directed DNA polymerase, eukaryota, reverse transcriptase zinc-binding domain protein [Tanacetum cinerariifolium]
MCRCLKDYLDAQERKQDKSTFETPVDFEEEILDAEVQANEAILLSDKEIALDAASSEGSMSGPDSGGEEAEAEKVEDIDIKAETTNGLENNDIIERLSLMKEHKALEHIKRMDLMQKAKVKWCIDGDENSKFFHGMINNKLSRSRIKGITINGS